MKKQYNEELVMNLVKALEIALPEGMSVLVGGSAEPSEKELALIIHQLSGKLCGNRTEEEDCDCGCVYGSREDWIPCDDEDEAENMSDWCKTCHYHVAEGCNGEDTPCGDYHHEEDWDYGDEDEEEEPHANMERIREMLEDIAELMEGL